jgi:hypothetical protein
VVVKRGPYVVLEQWLCFSGTRSVRGTETVAVWYWNEGRTCFWSSGCVVVERGPCVVLMQWLCGSGMRSVRGI